jgi:hypothetical protein
MFFRCGVFWINFNQLKDDILVFKIFFQARRVWTLFSPMQIKSLKLLHIIVGIEYECNIT